MEPDQPSFAYRLGHAAGTLSVFGLMIAAPLLSLWLLGMVLLLVSGGPPALSALPRASAAPWILPTEAPLPGPGV
ncbi:MAG: hypothetical protein ACFBRM_03595 [Pikeienuella sp.]